MCPSPVGQSGGVNIVGTVGTVGGDIVGRDKISYGLAEDLVRILEPEGVFRRAAEVGLDPQVIVSLARRLTPVSVLDLNQAISELERAVAVAMDVIAKGKSGAEDSDFVNDVLSQVAHQTRRGDFDSGRKTITEAISSLEATNQNARIALLEDGIKLDILRRDPVAVAQRIEALVAIGHPSERAAWLPEFAERYSTFYEDGQNKGSNFSMSVAVELARRMLASASDNTERGIAANLLANALSTLGEREGGTAWLEEAVSVYRTALKEYTRDRLPLDWAVTQNNLGGALLRLGQRESGTARLEEAVAAFRAALEEYTRERVPLAWATTQSNLGRALLRIGERESGTARQEDAVAAFRAAMTEWTRERVPLEWAATQNNLGSALLRLGQREGGTARLEEAVAAFRAALTEWTRERVPLQWAAAQHNLGNALSALGERKGGTAWLEEAVVASERRKRNTHVSGSHSTGRKRKTTLATHSAH